MRTGISAPMFLISARNVGPSICGIWTSQITKFGFILPEGELF